MRTLSWTSLLLGVALAAACSSTGEGVAAVGSVAPVAESTPPVPVTARSATPSTPPAITPDSTGPRSVPSEPPNAAVLDFTARRLDGGTIDGGQLAGGDVVLWMWAPWCPQCNREAPHVAEAVAAFGDRVTFVGIAGHDTDDAHRAFVAEHGLDGVVQLVDDDGSLWSMYGVSYQPAWVFVDDGGTTRVVAGGLYDDLEANLQALVDE